VCQEGKGGRMEGRRALQVWPLPLETIMRAPMHLLNIFKCQRKAYLQSTYEVYEHIIALFTHARNSVRKDEIASLFDQEYAIKFDDTCCIV
jgi:hypothetical protein